MRAIWRARAFCLCCSRATKLFLTRACRKSRWVFTKNDRFTTNLKGVETWGEMWENEGFKGFQDFMASTLVGDYQTSSILLGALGPLLDESDWGRSWKFQPIHHFPLFQDQKGIERLRLSKISTLPRSQKKKKSPAGVVWLPSVNCWSLVIYRSSTAAAAAAAGIFQFSIQSIQPIDARDSTSPAGLLAIRPVRQSVSAITWWWVSCVCNPGFGPCSCQKALWVSGNRRHATSRHPP